MPTTYVQNVQGRRFFPLDEKLKLRADHWSDGAARVAVRQGLQAKSFDLAAEAYGDAVGGGMSSDSLRRLTEGWGQKEEDKRKSEAERVYAQKSPEPAQKVVKTDRPIGDQANLSTDGGMVLLREEGWKEVKLSVISEVMVSQVVATAHDPFPDPQITLKQHSYQAGLWDADEMGQHQYLEGTRRQVEGCPRFSSTNDGALWIERITASNYPQALQILDWGHADERLWKVAKAVFGEGTPQTQSWAQHQIEQLWNGRGNEVVTALNNLHLNQLSCPEDICQSATYFEARIPKIDYARFRQEGYPIGSGTVESAVNTVVHHRLKRQGRGWKRQCAQSMLAGLSELHSGRFLSAWNSCP